MIKNLIEANRSYRRFVEHQAVTCETLRELVDLARLSASGANRQPLKYLLSCTPERNAAIFPHLAWAGYLTRTGPVRPRASGRRPTSSSWATRRSAAPLAWTTASPPRASCWARPSGAWAAASSPRSSGRRCARRWPSTRATRSCWSWPWASPRSTVVVEPVGPDGDIKYWRDAEGVHHVPKRALDDLIVG